MSDVWEVEASGRKVVSQKGNMASCSTCISDLKAAKLDLFVLVHCREGGVCFTADGGAEAKCEDAKSAVDFSLHSFVVINRDVEHTSEGHQRGKTSRFQRRRQEAKWRCGEAY